MNAVKIVALVLIAAGTLGLAFGGFNYTKDTQAAKFGPIEFSVKEQKTVDMPVWASIGAIVVGAGMLLVGSKKD